jgi:NADPH2:quinone reductase
VRALCFRTFGEPEVLRVEDLPDPLPAAGHALVRTRAIGLNFADIYRRKGNYHLVGEPPFVPGYEAAGTVESVGVGCPLAPGDRVAFADSPFANAELVSVPYEKLIPLPDGISYETAAALLLQGLTAQYLVRDSHCLKPGETMLVHAAAGGVGLLLVQLGRRAGARVLGVTSTETKARAVMEAGAESVALSTGDWVISAQAFAPGGVDVVYDSIGTTLRRSFEAVRQGGQVVFYGMAGGDPEPIAPRYLMDTSKTLTGGDLWNILVSREERVRRAHDLFAAVLAGRLKVHIAATYPLAEGAQAHATLEGRGTIGKILLIP